MFLSTFCSPPNASLASSPTASIAKSPKTIQQKLFLGQVVTVTLIVPSKLSIFCRKPIFANIMW